MKLAETEQTKILTKEERTEKNYPLFLPLREKKHMLGFIKSNIVYEPLCSEKLNTLYKTYCEFYTQRCTPDNDGTRLGKRAFKTTLKMLLDQHYRNVQVYSTRTGIIFAGIGLTFEKKESVYYN